jgi:predicted MPP superfamily phosphohydrolase
MDEKRDETLFGWVHLSDIHFGHGGAGYAPNQRLVLEELEHDVAANGAGARVDVILVTGDVAFSGNGVADDEYARARAWLFAVGKAAGVAPASIFLVPGNHDVNRSVDRDLSVGPLVESLRAGGRSVDEVLGARQGREILARRIKGFLEAATEFGPWSGHDRPPAEDRLYWARTLDADGGLKIRLVGLNTALLAKDVDEGKLHLGEKQLSDTLLPGAAPGELVVVLSHHPFRTGWLADEKNVDRWVRSRAHLHLSGHVHEAETEYSGSGGGNTFVRVVAGAAHAERNPDASSPARHGYSFGEVRRRGDGLVLRVYPRIWSDARKAFIPDGDGTLPNKSYAEHPLRVTMPSAPSAASAARVDDPPAPAVQVPAPAPRAPPPLPAGPLPTFISYAAADEKAVERLRVHLTQLGPKRDRLIDAWSVAQVGSGEEVRKAAAEHLRSARIILLLLSPDYIASDECYDVEMTAAVARHERGEARVIPVLLKECDYETAPFARLKFALHPHPDAPPTAVYGAGDPEVAFKRINEDVRAAVAALRERAGVA